MTRCLAQRASPALILVATTTCLASAIAASTAQPHSSNTLISTGLRNLGNTCYLNSQLQCAFHVPKIRHVLMGAPTDKHEYSSKMTMRQQGKKALACKPCDCSFKKCKLRRKVTLAAPVAPLQLCQSLGIPVMEQQDSQEFWKLLLPALECPQLVDLYQGAYEDYITAVDGSERERRREEPFLDLSLEVSRYASFQACMCALLHESKVLFSRTHHNFIRSQQQRIAIRIDARHVWNSRAIE